MSEIAYTLGNPKNYDLSIAEGRRNRQPIYKTGRTEDYLGGVVFRTKEEAQSYASENGLPYEPYGVLLLKGWDQEVDYSRSLVNYDCLLVDAEIITLDEARLRMRITPSDQV